MAEITRRNIIVEYEDNVAALQARHLAASKTVKGFEDAIESAKKEVSGEGVALDKTQKAIKGYDNETQKAAKSTKNFTSLTTQLQRAVAGIAFAKLATELSDLAQTLENRSNKANVVFGDSLGFVEQRANELANSIGLTRSEFVGLAANTADVLKPLGFTEQQAARLSTNITDLAGSFSIWDTAQRSTAEISQVLNSALTGEFESLKSLGIVIKEATVTEALRGKGLDRLTGQQLEQARAATILELVTQKSIDAQKNAIENNDSLTIKQAELTAKLQETVEEIATDLIPVFKALVEAAIFVVDGFGDISGVVERNRVLFSALATIVGAYTAVRIAATLATQKAIIQEKILSATIAFGNGVFALRTAATTAYSFVLNVFTGRIKLATAATIIFNSALGLVGGVIGAVVLAVGALVTGLTAYEERSQRSLSLEKDRSKFLGEVEKATTKLNESQKEFNDSIKNYNTLAPKQREEIRKNAQARLDDAKAALVQLEAQRKQAAQSARELTVFQQIRTFFESIDGTNLGQLRSQEAAKNEQEELEKTNGLLDDYRATIANIENDITDLDKREVAIAENRKKRTDEQVKAEKKRLEDLRKEIDGFNKDVEKFDEQRRSEEIEAERKIQDARIDLIQDATERKIAQLRLGAEREKMAVLGTDAQRALQQQLIEEKLQSEILAIREKGLEDFKRLSDELINETNANAEQQVEADESRRVLLELREVDSQILKIKQDIANGVITPESIDEANKNLERLELEKLRIQANQLGITPEAQNQLQQQIADLQSKINEEGRNRDSERAKQRIESAKSIADSLIDIEKKIADGRIEQIDREIEAQQKRVDAARATATQGTAEQLEIEQQRLDGLLQKREEAAQRQRTIAAIEIATNAAVTISSTIGAVISAFKEGDIFKGIATALSLTSTIASTVLSVRSALSGVGSFSEGTDLLTASDGIPTGRSDGMLIEAHPRESILNEKETSKLRKLGISNKDVPDLVEKALAYEQGNFVETQSPYVLAQTVRPLTLIDDHSASVNSEMLDKFESLLRTNEEMKKELKRNTETLKKKDFVSVLTDKEIQNSYKRAELDRKRRKAAKRA